MKVAKSNHPKCQICLSNTDEHLMRIRYLNCDDDICKERATNEKACEVRYTIAKCDKPDSAWVISQLNEHSPDIEAERIEKQLGEAHEPEPEQHQKR